MVIEWVLVGGVNGENNVTGKGREVFNNCLICAELTANMDGLTTGYDRADDLSNKRGVYILWMAGAAEINAV